MERLQATAGAGGPGPARNPYFGSGEPIDDETTPACSPALTIEPFIGHRLWRLVPGTVVGDRPEHPILRSATRGMLWEGPTVTASCPARRDRGRLHPTEAVPAQGCVCGIYALKRPAPPPRPWAWAQGPIALTGRVLEGRLGYRAERARIIGPLVLSLGGVRPTCLKPSCRRPADWVRVGPRLYLPRCTAHLQPEVDGMFNLPLDEFLRNASESFGERYGIGIEGA
ncbi:MAG: hypothetical protein MUP76_09165 [Acidimicrobiia bacterium]|nr:hypothetical protein [Acidimicrobiia bacterium]